MVNSKVVVELCPPTVESFGTATRYQQHNSTCILVLIGSYFAYNDYKMHAWGMITESMEDVSISLIKKSDSLPWPVPLHCTGIGTMQVPSLHSPGSSSLAVTVTDADVQLYTRHLLHTATTQRTDLIEAPPAPVL